MDNQTKEILKVTPLTCNRVGPNKLISDFNLYHAISACPFFTTYEDGHVSPIDADLLPLFRYFHSIRMSNSLSFSKWLDAANKYFVSKNFDIDKINMYKKYFINFYTMFSANKKYTTLFPYFPWVHGTLSGCIEAVIQNESGIRMYCYDLQTEQVSIDNLNFYGFKLQLAARIFHIKTGIEPSTMALCYPKSKQIVYYTYNKDEHLEDYEDRIDEKFMIRKYGGYCDVCLQSSCKPLMDKTGKYGWKIAELEEF